MGYKHVLMDASMLTAPAAEPAMEIAASLVEQFLPELMMPLADKCGSNMDMAEVMRQIEWLATELGMQRADSPDDQQFFNGIDP